MIDYEWLDENLFAEEQQAIINSEVKEKYTKQNLKNALKEVSEGSSVYAASKKHNVPQTTLRDRLKGDLNETAGRQPILDLKTEKQLAEWIIESAEMGDPRTKEEVLTAATELCKLKKKPTKNDLLSNSWLKGFIKRNPSVTFRTPQAVTRASANVSEDDIRRFFTHFYSWVEKNDLLHCLEDSSRFLNSDETGFDLNPSPQRVLAKKGSKNVYRVDPSKPKQRVSVMYTFAANGTCYIPQLIFKKSCSKIGAVLRALGECGANYVISASDSGYQTQETFEGFVKENLIKELDERGVVRNAKFPVFYFLDGHKSHYSYRFIMWCRENFIVIITFFPNATRILQMCDVAMFGAGKKHWTKEVQRWKIETKNSELDEASFVTILKRVNDKFITKESIINGFRVTGIQPFCVENVLFDRCIGVNRSTADKSSSQEIAIILPPTQSEVEVYEPSIPLIESIEQPTQPEIESYEPSIPQIESIESTTTSEVLEAVQKMYELSCTIISPYIAEHHPNSSFMTKSIEQFLTLIGTEISPPQAQLAPSTQTSVLTNARPRSDEFKSVSDILKPPKPFEEIEETKVLADKAKELKKVQREDRKKQNEVIRNMKKEKAEEKKNKNKRKQLQEPEVEPKTKRGRKPKASA